MTLDVGQLATGEIVLNWIVGRNSYGQLGCQSWTCEIIVLMIDHPFFGSCRKILDKFSDSIKASQVKVISLIYGLLIFTNNSQNI